MASLLLKSYGDPMEIDLRSIVWPVCVIQCNEALTRVKPGEDLGIIVSDPDVVDNIVLLIKSRPELEFDQCREFHGYRISVRRRLENQHVVTEPIRATTK